MSHSRLYVIFLILTVLAACKTSQPIRPVEHYDPNTLENETSILRIPVKIFKTELQSNINRRIQGVIYEDKEPNEDDLMLRATKTADIQLDLQGQNILYKVPLSIWVKKGLAITSAEATGELELEFKTRFNIKNDWNLETVTLVEGFRWIKKPVAKIGFISLPVEFIANTILRRSKTMISEAIDKQVVNSFNLRNTMLGVWKQISEPVLVSEAYNSWILLRPRRLALSPFRATDGAIETHIFVESSPSLLLGNRPPHQNVPPLPDFVFGDFGTTEFQIAVQTMVPFTEAERLAKINLVGYTYQQGKQKVTVQDIRMYGQGNRLVVDTKLSGNYNGSVYMIGEPVYNPSKNRVELSDLDFELDTRNFLMRSAAWLFKGTLKNKIKENLDFYLDANLEEIRKTIQTELDNFVIAPGVKLIGNLSNIGLRNAYITPEGIRVTAQLKGTVAMEVHGF